jgi:hypothetical protein
MPMRRLLSDVQSFFEKEFTLTNLQRYAQARADLDRDDIELAEREEDKLAELRQFSSPNGKATVLRDKPSRFYEVKSELEEIRTARASITESRTALLKEEEQAVRASLQAKVHTEIRKMGPALLQVFESLKAIQADKDNLMARGFGYWPVPCPIVTDDSFRDELVSLIRECADHGFCKLPSELR